MELAQPVMEAQRINRLAAEAMNLPAGKTTDLVEESFVFILVAVFVGHHLPPRRLSGKTSGLHFIQRKAGEKVAKKLS